MSGRWTPERTTMCKTLFLDGLSCAEVARRLGPGFTRNMVISKISRMGLSAADRTLTTSVPVRPARQAAPVLAPLPQVKPIAPPAAVQEVKAIRPALAVSLVLPPPARPVAPKSLRTCQWPKGDPAKPGFHMCGGDLSPGRPYCAGHSAEAFVPRTAKKASVAELHRSVRRYA